MDKKKIHDFAVKARRELIESVELKLTQVGITRDGVKEKLPTSTAEIAFYVPNDTEGVSGRDTSRRVSLVQRLQTAAAKDDWHTAYDNLVEEASYTWFNRIIALRFMEVNHYLPSRVAVLSSEEGRAEPDILAHALEIEDDLGGFSDEQRDLIQHAQETQEPAAMDNAYRLLFLKQANALNANLPHLFEKTTDAFQLLFTPSYQNGVIKELVTEVPRDDFDVEKEGQVEIIGWLYQYYNEEPHDQVVNINGGPVKTDDIPAATQLFTTDWVVRYMVDNSLGKKYLEHYPDSPVKGKLKYLLPGDITPDQSDFDITRIQVMDNAMGSGHILAYAFDVLMTMYEDQGYAKREAANSIIQNNLFGLEIDRRAFQLSYFSLMMKLRRYDRQALNRSVMPNIYVFIAAPAVTEEFLHSLKASSEVIDEIQDIAAHFMDAKTLGSIIELPANYDYAGMRNALEPVATAQKISLFGNQQTAQQLLEIIATAETMTQRYDVVVTNPPYLNKMNSTLKKYVKKHYKDYSADLFSVFIWHNINMAKANGYASYMTPVSWMFLKSFEKLRDSVLQLTSIASLIQMETHAYFDEAYVTINTFVLKKATDKTDKVGTYLRLVDFTGGMEVQRQKVTAAIVDPSVNYLYRTNQTNFGKIPGSPIAYWASANLIHDFEVGKPLSEYVDPRQGLATADNNRFLRQWFEVAYSSIKFDARSIEESISSRKKWFPYNKGGAYRKWYGNYDYIVNWENDGYEIKNFKDSNGKVRSRPQNTDYYFREAITWSDVTSGILSFRIRDAGSIFDVVGMSIFPHENVSKAPLLGFLNSKVANLIMDLLNPTIHASIGYMKLLPVILNGMESVDSSVHESVFLSRSDWNSYESSHEFRLFPLLIHIAEHNRNWTVEAAFNQWKQEAQDRFDQLKKNEEELNKIFIDLYGLQDELSPEESDKEVSVRKADLGRDIRAFMSYFIGVTFGRYSLDTPGLAFAGGDWGASKYTSYQPNTDDVIVLTDSDYFGDDRDIMHRFREFLTVTFGEEHLEENFTFIAKALGKAGDTAEDQIRSYLFNDFYKNHLTIYQKRPIYWQLDSGRQGGFKALMYLHRYDGDTMAMIRTSYLHTLQAAYEKRVTTLDTFITSETNTRQKNQLIKQRDHTRKQLEELVKYDAQLQHVANMHIAIDLDDGVVVNHQKVQADVKLLTPIK
ncbi:BREX-1 system adenine-specific DNA-methyltransferase PglX [Limosilactobacillus fermentum]|uniref:site-specific DNA-methyltransferase (adenine-specific) n=1 Tax=Limosilactobacillus fermentum 3872 TaxID=1381124 RepID=A0A806T239_LIMFE|nr:BREX-1 system adenine-specific DNA-methyltransferase PglX [Limosilactobacillus fermentum]AKM50605.1 restriction endonuclease subunit M [Limosilactobacillus fermentum 3872]KAB1960940.1 BREX-1 system adenine-specific DNA-methyltransferase PglX [Limosilactobacillus fermentum]